MGTYTLATDENDESGIGVKKKEENREEDEGR